MKNMGEVFYVIGINIKRDKSQRILGLSQEAYINKVLERFRMKDCSSGIAPIVKGDRFSLYQCLSNDLEKKEMKNILYAFECWVDIKEIQVWNTRKLQRKKSTSGYVFLLVGGVISWRNAKQIVAATLTIETEFVSCFEATS
ncbi:hypothetical protein AAG906_027831 [Vitis piasezkii]